MMVGTPIFEGGRELPQDWPLFLTFSDPIGSLLWPTWSYWPPFSGEKIRLSLSHLVPEIIWPKVGQICQQNLSFDRFQAFCTNLFPWFLILLTPFFIVLRSFSPFIFPKPSIPLGPFFIMHIPPPSPNLGMMLEIIKLLMWSPSRIWELWPLMWNLSIQLISIYKSQCNDRCMYLADKWQKNHQSTTQPENLNL